MDGFNVDAVELIAIGRQLAGVRDDLHGAHRRIEQLRARALGSDVVDDALNEFADHWRFGLGRMRDRAGFVSEALSAAGRSYLEVESELAAGIGRAAAGTSTSPDAEPATGPAAGSEG
ncbi:MAG: hypothetical protein L0Y54_16420 [Sporichthyaceae bacterium]|nr:hypothetical protein [Sporichthyaceae bacterium]